MCMTPGGRSIMWHLVAPTVATSFLDLDFGFDTVLDSYTIDSIDYVPGIGNFDYNVQARPAYPHLDFHLHLAYKTSPLSYV